MPSSDFDSLRNALERKEDEVRQLRAQVELAEAWLAKLQARSGRQDDSGLPVPRLELRWIGEEQEPEGEWEYNLVLMHLTGDPCFYPLGNTEVTGGVDPFHPDGTIRLPFRAGANIKHEMKQLRLPAFVVRGNKVERLGDA